MGDAHRRPLLGDVLEGEVGHREELPRPRELLVHLRGLIDRLERGAAAVQVPVQGALPVAEHPVQVREGRFRVVGMPGDGQGATAEHGLAGLEPAFRMHGHDGVTYLTRHRALGRVVGVQADVEPAGGHRQLPLVEPGDVVAVIPAQDPRRLVALQLSGVLHRRDGLRAVHRYPVALVEVLLAESPDPRHDVEVAVGHADLRVAETVHVDSAVPAGVTGEERGKIEELLRGQRFLQGRHG